MTMKNQFVLILIVSLLSQCISQDGLNCQQMKDGLCTRCQADFEEYPTADNFRTCRKTIEKCSLWTPDLRQCVQCSTDDGIKYSLFVEGQNCGINNCGNPDPSNPDKCLQCALGYQPDSENQQCIARIPNCQVYSSHTICKQCSQTYYLSTNSDMCILGSITNCNVYKDSKVCSTCVDTFQPSSTFNLCNPGSITNCLKYVINGKCSFCDVGYTVSSDQKRCIDKIPFCKTYDATGLCTTCIDTYMQNAVDNNNKLNTKCIPGTIPQCKTYKANAVCERCNDLFQPSADGASCSVGTITDCISYNSNGVCGKCIDPKMPNAAVGGGAAAGSSCGTGSVAKCKTYSAINVCAVCQTGYTLTIAAGGATTCVIKIQNCKTFTSDTACAVCQNTFQPTVDFSKCLTGTLLGCSVYLKKSECQTCGLGYTPVTKTCSGRITNCKEYLTDGNNNGFACKQCNDNFKPDANKGACANAPSDDNCIRYSDSSTCTQCAKDRTLVSGKCTEITGTKIANCQLYGTTEKICTKCADTFMPPVTQQEPNTCITGSVTDCKSYSGNSICQTCQIGYTLSSSTSGTITTTKCTTKIANCKTFTSDTVCSICEDNFEPSTGNTNCITGSIANCVTYQSKGVCKTCKIGSIINGAKTACAQVDANCLKFDSSNKCTQCKDQFRSDGNGKCVAAPDTDNCRVYTYSSNAVGTCIQCKKDYGFTSSNDKTCTSIGTTKIADCIDYDTTKTCKLCAERKRPSEAITAPAAVAAGATCANGDSTKNCVKYSSFTQCSQCEVAYTLTAGSCDAPSTPIMNCDRYESATKCKYCKQGFEPSADFKICTSPGLIKNCKLYKSQGVCQICADQYEPTSNSIKCQQGSIKDCKAYSANGICKQCQATFRLSGDNKSCVSLIDNCNTYKADGTTCSKCNDGFYLIPVDTIADKACTKGTVTNCKIYSQATANTCTTCNDKFYLSGTTCNSPSPLIPDCLGYDTATKCNRCVDGKMPIAADTGANPAILQGQSCATGNIDNCKVYKSDRKCQTCNIGYKTTDGLTCTSPSITNCQTYKTQLQCNQCQNEFQPTSDLTKCNAGSIKDCKQYLQKSKCGICEDGKQPSLDRLLCNAGTIDKCTVYQSKGMCKTCETGYKNVSGKCVDFITECKTYTTQTNIIKCSKCQDTYQPSGDKLTCTSPGSVTNCKVYAQNRKCGTCADQYFKKSETQCVKGATNDNCLVYDSQKVCTTCKDGKMQKELSATDSLCIEGTVTNCKSYSANKICSACNTGYTLSGTGTTATCTGSIAQCSTYNIDGTCKLCNNNFQPTIDFKKCEAGSISNCKQYSQKSFCKTCNDNFEISTDLTTCISGSIPNCLTYSSNNICSKCNTVSTLSTDGKSCKQNIANCNLYDGTDPKKCTQCKSSFQITSTNTCTATLSVSNCLIFSANGVCKTCANTFILQTVSTKTVCTKGTIPDCLTYTTKTQCSKCIDGKMPSAAGDKPAGSSCVNGTVTNCVSYTAAGVCGTCNAGFSGTTCATLAIANCKVFNNMASCKQCNDNSMPSIDFTKCETGSITDCVIYSQINKCSVCKDNSQPTIDFKRCITGTLTGCKKYSARAICSQCNIGYTLNKNSFLCQSNIVNCTAYTEDSTTKQVKCTKCTNQYVPNSTGKQCIKGTVVNCSIYTAINNCEKCKDLSYRDSATSCVLGTITNCTTYTSSTECSKCADGKMQSPDNKQCIEGTVTGCKTYESNVKCISCNPGYIFSAGQCTGRIQNCKQYTSDIACKICNDNFQPTTNFKCVTGSIINCKNYTSKGVCSTCNPGYKTSADKTKCQDNITNCKTYKNDGTQCTQCKNTFEPSTDKKSCATGSVANCLIYSGNKVCSTCIDKYFLQSGTCKQGTIADCLAYTSGTVCSKCIDGKMPSSNANTCINGKILNCKSYSGLNTCSACNIGFTFRSVNNINDCVSSIASCMNYTSQTVCNKCIDQFQLSIDGARCDKGTIGGCLAYEGYNKCSKCVTNLILTDDKAKCNATIPNCQVYNTDKTCKSCLSNFQLSTDFKTCTIVNIQFCNTYTFNGVCSACQDKFTLSEDKKTCTPTIRYCQSFTGDDCGKCFDGYLLQDSKCFAGSIKSCKEYQPLAKVDDPQMCKQCQIGNQLSLDKDKCIPTIQNCRIYEAFDKCNLCHTGFQIYSVGKCRKMIQQCTTYSPDGKICTACSTGYKVGTPATYCTNSSINCNINNCLNCATTDSCGTCVKGLQLSTDQKQCLTCLVDGCKTCKSQDSCGVCQDGLSLAFVDSKYVCYSCLINNCISCDKDGDCDSCENGYFFDSTNKKCVPCQSPCQSCQSLTKCTSCITPTYLKTTNQLGSCIMNTIPNCASYDITNSALCAQCLPFFKLSIDKKTCTTICKQNCKQCPGDKCTICNEGLFLSNGVCTPCAFGCAQCTSNTLCTKTISKGFYIVSGSVKPCPQYCKQCSLDGTCTVFSDIYNGFIVSKNGDKIVLIPCEQGCQSCSPTNLEQCLTCKVGYYLNSATKKCLPCTSASNCKTCDPLNPEKCITCFANAVKNNDKCSLCAQNCITCSSTDVAKCTRCTYGHYLQKQDSTCIKGTINQCNTYTDMNKCQKCEPGYTTINTVSKTVCVPCVTNCKNCAKGEPGKCINCGDGFFLNSQNTCTACSSNCKSCTSAGCTQCNPGYKVNSAFKCALSCADTCATCSDSSPISCNSCTDGYKLNGALCQPQTTCTGGCKRCPLGYVLNPTSSTCEICKGKNCRTCDLNRLTCKSCMKGFYLNPTTFLCVACSAGCTICSSATSCSQCASGYVALKSIDNPNGLKCVACQGRCATCVDTTMRCTSCKLGYELKGWKCIKNKRWNFSMTLDTTLANFYSKYFDFMNALTSHRADEDYIQLDTIKQGSVILTGTLDQVNDNLQASNGIAQNFLTNNALRAGAEISNMPIISSTFSVRSSSSTVQTEANDNSLGLILGISIPVGILVLALIAFIVYTIRKKNNLQTDDEKDKVHEEDIHSNEVINKNQV